MPLPVNATVGAAPNFAANLEAARAFFVTQDADSANTRFGQLKSELREMQTILTWSPGCGRPARFLNAHSDAEVVLLALKHQRQLAYSALQQAAVVLQRDR